MAIMDCVGRAGVPDAGGDDLLLLRKAMRTALIVGNWKMHKLIAEAVAFTADVLPRLSGTRAEIALAPAFTALGPLVQAVGGAGVAIYAQNMHEAPFGPFTGEVSAPMLVELGVAGVILGHSERRRLFGETDRALRQKVPAALRAGLQPILCVGQSDRSGGGHELRQQLQEDLAGVDEEQLADVVIAYEPLWAIGTGTAATCAQAQEASAFVRALVAERSPAAAERIRILYGGCVTPAASGELLAQPDVDGALVADASLDPVSFAAIVAAA